MYRYCPSCGVEHRLGFTHCADCGVELVDEPPPPKTEDERAGAGEWTELVEVYRVGPLEADVMRSVLEGSGIPAVVERAGSSAAYPLTVGDLGNAKVLVQRERVEEALAVIHAAEGGDLGSADSETGDAYDYGYDETRGPLRFWDRIPWFVKGLAIIILALPVIVLLLLSGLATRGG